MLAAQEGPAEGKRIAIAQLCGCRLHRETAAEPFLGQLVKDVFLYVPEGLAFAEKAAPQCGGAEPQPCGDILMAGRWQCLADLRLGHAGHQHCQRA